jgi:hypothetical protein
VAVVVLSDELDNDARLGAPLTDSSRTPAEGVLW